MGKDYTIKCIAFVNELINAWSKKKLNYIKLKQLVYKIKDSITNDNVASVEKKG